MILNMCSWSLIESGSLTIVVLVLLFWSFITKSDRERLPGPPSSSVFGNLNIFHTGSKSPQISVGETHFSRIVAMSVLFAKEGLFKIRLGHKTFVFIYKPDMVEKILSSNELINKSSTYQFFAPWLGQGLLVSKNEKWRKHRKILTPAFSTQLLGNFLQTVNRQGKVLCGILAEKVKVDDGIIPRIINDYKMANLDIICESVMGIEMHHQRNPSAEYVRALHSMFQMVMHRAFRPWLYTDFAYFLTTKGKKFAKLALEVQRFTEKVIWERKQKLEAKVKSEQPVDTVLGVKEKHAFLDTLLLEHLREPSKFTEQDIKDEVNVSVVAGYDITSVALSWITYCIGLYPDIQRQMYTEIVDIMGYAEKELTLDDLRQMKYTECVVKEALRLYPPAPYIAREIDREIAINRWTLFKGTTVFIFAHSTHRDPEHWDQPERFQPQRFTPENSSKRHPYAYLPYSAGPRNCIAQKFGMVQVKALVVHLLSRFKVTSLNERDKVTINPAVLLLPTSSSAIKLEPRSPI